MSYVMHFGYERHVNTKVWYVVLEKNVSLWSLSLRCVNNAVSITYVWLSDTFTWVLTH